jgi:putative ATP-binding cassette transporter
MAFLRDVAALAGPFWRSKERARSGRLLAMLLLVKAATIYALILQNHWLKDFYEALQAHDLAAFGWQCGVFSVLAVLIAGSHVYGHWLGWSIKTHWRSFMIDAYVGDWLGNRTYYRMPLEGCASTNPDQRISEDIGIFADKTLDLTVAFLDAGTALIAYGVVLWNLSGIIHVSGVGVPGTLLMAALVFSAVGSILVQYLGNPLTGIFERRSTLEAEFRYSVLRVRENAESVAFYRGEAAEKREIHARWQDILVNIWQGLRQERKLHWFQNLHGQFSVIVPFLLCAPRFFAGQIGFGEVMQITAAFASVSACLSLFISSYGSIAAWRATTERVKLFRADLDAFTASQGSKIRTLETEGGLTLHDLSLDLPDGSPLFSGLHLNVAAGRALLIKGPSGTGKSTLLRACAGLWPYGSGRIDRPWDAFFVPQRCYLPLGTLRQAVCYPGSVDVSDAEIVHALRMCNLDHLKDRLNENGRWSHTLSGGEQQRLAFARILLRRPPLVFLDEATSALDEANEALVYRRLRDADWKPTVVSIGHRPSLDRFHDESLDMGLRRAQAA